MKTTTTKRILLTLPLLFLQSGMIESLQYSVLNKAARSGAAQATVATSTLSGQWCNNQKRDNYALSSRIRLGMAKESSEDAPFISILGSMGLVSQPIVWASLYSVATSGAGLPAGPLGLLGAVEGVSYLVVVVLVARKLLLSDSSSGTIKTAETLSLFSLGISLLVVTNLVADQGCIPNAKPILDYSNYVPVCNPDQTPGLFGN
mmetsp:Transcript_20607/g.25481  ORF Transcript_20607/g.25481 Transcript_20607/m.25481 type:complete len:204 (+) Transcript_20607:172-783(+)